MIRTALALAKKGLAVFPCRARDKRPATERGLLDASKDAEIIEQWWQQNPHYNIAVATGAPSNIFAIDIDGFDGEASLRALEAKHGELPATVESITGGGGRHILFQMPDGVSIRNSAGKLAPNVDVRASGGYIVMPPSIHPDGGVYCWSVDSASAFAQAPDWLIAKITEHTNGNGKPTPPSEWRALVMDGVSEGARDCSAARLAGYLLRIRFSAEKDGDCLGVVTLSRYPCEALAGSACKSVTSVA